LLVVDAAQGVEAQTISNLYLALDAGLEIIPVLNKIDLPSAEVDRISRQVIDLIGCKEEDILKVSAKANIGIDELLEEIVKRIPPPKGNPGAPLQALIFDSIFDAYRGAVAYIRVFDGTLRTNDKIKFFVTDKIMDAEEIGVLGLKKVKVDELSAGNVGYLISGIKDVRYTKVGDTVTQAKNGAEKPLPGYKEVKPMVYSGLYPTDSDDYEGLRDALEKFRLNDSALVYQPKLLLHLDLVSGVDFLECSIWK